MYLLNTYVHTSCWMFTNYTIRRWVCYLIKGNIYVSRTKFKVIYIMHFCFSKLHSPKWIWLSVHGRGIRSNYIMHHHKGTSELFIDPIKGFSNVNKDTCMYHFRLKLIKYLDRMHFLHSDDIIRDINIDWSPAILTFWWPH